MKNVSKKTQAEIDETMTLYSKAKEELKTAIADANEKINQMVTEVVNDKIETLNSAIQRLNELRDQVSSDITDFVDDKSDNWRDGERGAAYQEWQTAWENELEEIEAIDVDGIEMPEVADEPLNDGDYPREPSV